jgi:hypothetical protein
VLLPANRSRKDVPGKPGTSLLFFLRGGENDILPDRFLLDFFTLSRATYATLRASSNFATETIS